MGQSWIHALVAHTGPSAGVDVDASGSAVDPSTSAETDVSAGVLPWQDLLFLLSAQQT